MADLLNLKNSKLILEGNKDLQDAVSKKISDAIVDLGQDKTDRTTIYGKRRDFYSGNQSAYSNIFGVLKDTKQKKGHTNQVTNYAGVTVKKMAYGIANNPPSLIIPALDQTDDTEVARAQAVQDHADSVFDDKKNRFWKKTYRRGAFNQAIVGDAAIKTYLDYGPDGKQQICITGQDDMSMIYVGWNGTDPEEFDFVITETYITPAACKELYGIVVDERQLPLREQTGSSSGTWDSDTWGAKSPNQNTNKLPTGKNKQRVVKVQDFDSLDFYAIKIEGELVQLVLKDDITFPRVKFWTIVKNIPNPPSPWSIADIDFLIDPQIELNDNDNRTSDYIRVGGVQRYVAYNMNDFDPESIKTSSGQVIFVNDPEGKSHFDPLPTNINNFPADQYNLRKMNQIYDMGLPKVNFGAAGVGSGRSKAVDFQSSIDMTIFKRDAWELALQDIVEKIQIFGHFLHPELDWWNDTDDNFVIRKADFDWTDILPTSQSDKIVNVANKVNMIGIPLVQAYKEMGYRNPEAMLEQLKKELKDPDLMIIRSKMWPLSQGILTAQNQAAVQGQSNGSEAGGGQAEPAPTLTAPQSDVAKPMASQVGSAFSSLPGMMDKARQNMAAGGR